MHKYQVGNLVKVRTVVPTVPTGFLVKQIKTMFHAGMKRTERMHLNKTQFTLRVSHVSITEF